MVLSTPQGGEHIDEKDTLLHLQGGVKMVSGKPKTPHCLMVSGNPKPPHCSSENG
jgi:hypothetical protein